eukprot:jgi/Mesen1/5958/ME000301S05082
MAMRRAVTFVAGEGRAVSKRLADVYSAEHAGAMSLGSHRGFKTKPKLSVILTTHVEELGRPGQVVKVAPGYARNKLLPQRTALPAIPKYLALMAKERQGLADAEGEEARVEEEKAKEVAVVSDEDRLKEAEAAAVLMDKLRLVRALAIPTPSIRRHTPHKSDILRQPVTAADVVREIERQMGVQLTEAHLNMPPPIGKIGDYEIPLQNLPKGVRLPGEKEIMNLRVHIRRP